MWCTMQNVVKVIQLSARAKKDIIKLPAFIVNKLLAWVDDVQIRGLEKVRKISGYHDEPLKGDRKGQRSIRLNKAYRAIYIIEHDGTIKFVHIIEVNKHEY